MLFINHRYRRFYKNRAFAQLPSKDKSRALNKDDKLEGPLVSLVPLANPAKQ